MTRTPTHLIPRLTDLCTYALKNKKGAELVTNGFTLGKAYPIQSRSGYLNQQADLRNDNGHLRTAMLDEGQSPHIQVRVPGTIPGSTQHLLGYFEVVYDGQPNLREEKHENNPIHNAVRGTRPVPRRLLDR